jgi:3-phosphoshikimate 1-carboxyvinyltransferase
MCNYPRQIEIRPLVRKPRASVRVPGSKSITNRALVLAALTNSDGRECVLEGALQCEDTEVMVESLGRLGFQVAPNWHASKITVSTNTSGQIVPTADLFIANSGTSMRFLTAIVSLGHGRYRLDGVARMRERPIEDLLTALNQLGINAESENRNGCPPVVIEGHGLPGGSVRIRGGVSSQFLSGLLMAAPFAQSDLSIAVEGTLVSVPYVTLTVSMMRQFGLTIEQNGPDQFAVPAPQRPTPLPRYVIEPDATAASYFFGAAAISGGSVGVGGLSTLSLQGDVRFVEILEQMGCHINHGTDFLTVHGGPLRGIDVDMNGISDTVMTLGAIACFAEGSTTIYNVGHIRNKETDRLAALATELRRLGARVKEYGHGLTITPAPLHGAVIETYNDHRVAMSLALIGLRIPGIVIDHPACVAKTYPGFFDDLERLR